MDIVKKGTCLVVQILCWAALAMLAIGLLAGEDDGAAGMDPAVERAAITAAAQRYDQAMEEYGDPMAADAVAQALYEELGGARESWQVRAQ